jgi:hypothetical protein
LVFHSGLEADHSSPSSAEVKEWVEMCLHSPMRLHGVVLCWWGAEGQLTYTLSDLFKLQISWLCIILSCSFPLRS